MSKSRPAMHAAMHVDAARASGSIPWSLPKDTSKSTADDGAFLLTQSRSFFVTSLKICWLELVVCPEGEDEDEEHPAFCLLLRLLL
tara:strand:+ start:9270 stop:9527 length:258 start_codon:yes stop_codon:yes gene_type:complete